jgi:hypothetical protein
MESDYPRSYPAGSLSYASEGFGIPTVESRAIHLERDSRDINLH